MTSASLKHRFHVMGTAPDLSGEANTAGSMNHRTRRCDGNPLPSHAPYRDFALLQHKYLARENEIVEFRPQFHLKLYKEKRLYRPPRIERLSVVHRAGNAHGERTAQRALTRSTSVA